MKYLMSRVFAVLAALVLVLAGATAAQAIPPSGAGPNTPGTSSQVSPSTLRAGQRVNFTVQGFPAGETIYIKIDDGVNCTQAATHGACVYHMQKIPSSGVVSGSFALPGDLSTGEHSLRFLASETMPGGQGVKGYTLRSSSFRVTAANSASTGSSGATGSSSGTSTSTGRQPTVSNPGLGRSNAVAARPGAATSQGSATVRSNTGSTVTAPQQGQAVQQGQADQTVQQGQAAETTGDAGVVAELPVLTIGEVSEQTPSTEPSSSVPSASAPATTSEPTGTAPLTSAASASSWVSQIPWLGISVGTVLIAASIILMMIVQYKARRAAGDQ